MDTLLSLVLTALVPLVIYWLFEGLTFRDAKRKVAGAKRDACEPPLAA